MNMKQDRDLAIQWDMVCRKLKGTGADLSRIRIAMERNAAPSYITKRIMLELEGRK